MSINVFKKHPDNKITFSNRAILCGELKVMGSRPKVIFCVHGSMVGVVPQCHVTRCCREHQLTQLPFLAVNIITANNNR